MSGSRRTVAATKLKCPGIGKSQICLCSQQKSSHRYYPVPGSENGCKAESRKQPPYAAVFDSTKPQHMVEFLSPEIVSLPRSMKNPRFGTGDEVIKVWFSSACTNMGQQSRTTRCFFQLFSHTIRRLSWDSPLHLHSVYHERRRSSIGKPDFP